MSQNQSVDIEVVTTRFPVYYSYENYDDFPATFKSATYTHKDDAITAPETLSAVIDRAIFYQLIPIFQWVADGSRPAFSFSDQTGASATKMAQHLNTFLSYIDSEGGSSTKAREVFRDLAARNVKVEVTVLTNSDFDAKGFENSPRAASRYAPAVQGADGGPPASNSTIRMYLRQGDIDVSKGAYMDILAHETLHFALNSSGNPYSEQQILNMEHSESLKLFSSNVHSDYNFVDSLNIKGTTYQEVVQGTDGNNVINTAQGGDNDLVLTGEGNDYIVFSGVQETIAVTGGGTKVLERLPVNADTGTDLVLDLRDVLGDIDGSTGGWIGPTSGTWGTDYDDAGIVTKFHYDENWNQIVDEMIVLKHEATGSRGVVIVGTDGNPRYYSFDVFTRGSGYARSAGGDTAATDDPDAMQPDGQMPRSWIEAYEASLAAFQGHARPAGATGGEKAAGSGVAGVSAAFTPADDPAPTHGTDVMFAPDLASLAADQWFVV